MYFKIGRYCDRGKPSFNEKQKTKFDTQHKESSFDSRSRSYGAYGDENFVSDRNRPFRASLTLYFDRRATSAAVDTMSRIPYPLWRSTDEREQCNVRSTDDSLRSRKQCNVFISKPAKPTDRRQRVRSKDRGIFPAECRGPLAPRAQISQFERTGILYG